MDRNKATFLDVLIECDQKTVVSNAAVSYELKLDLKSIRLGLDLDMDLWTYVI